MALTETGNTTAAGTSRLLVIFGFVVQAAMFAAMIATNKFPADYEFLNVLCTSFWISVILVFKMGRQNRLTTILAIAVALFFVFSRVYLSSKLGFQDGLAKNFGLYTILFYQTSNLAMACWGYVFCMSLAGLVHAGKNGFQRDPALFSMAFWGFISYSFCQLFGSIWALTSGWGDVWVWASSHLHSAVLWIFYAALLHVPFVPRLPEKTGPVMGVVGFTAIVVYIFFHDLAIVPAYFLLFT